MANDDGKTEDLVQIPKADLKALTEEIHGLRSETSDVQKLAEAVSSLQVEVVTKKDLDSVKRLLLSKHDALAKSLGNVADTAGKNFDVLFVSNGGDSLISRVNALERSRTEITVAPGAATTVTEEHHTNPRMNVVAVEEAKWKALAPIIMATAAVLTSIAALIAGWGK